MKLFSFIAAAVMLVTSTTYAHDHAKDKKKAAHDKEHQHVSTDKMDHDHEEMHHGDHDHKAHHPEHVEQKTEVKKTKKSK